MSDLVAVAYPDQHRAAEVLATLRRLQTGRLIDLDDAVVVTKDAEGAMTLQQAVNLTAAGAAGGATWGLLIGAIFSIPLAFIPGVGWAAIGAMAATAGVGAAAGAIGGHFSDYGVDDTFVKELGGQMQPNSSALFVLVRNVQPDRVVDEVRKFGGTVLRTSLSKEADARLQAALAEGAAGGASPATPQS